MHRNGITMKTQANRGSDQTLGVGTGRIPESLHPPALSAFHSAAWQVEAANPWPLLDSHQQVPGYLRGWQTDSV
jgi:hypothetical protein